MRISTRLAVAATVAAIAASIPQTGNAAERVCRQECVGPVCEQRCVETDGRGERLQERRDERLEERREERQEDRRDRGPAIELRVPGIEIERR
jgi:hypothetical protein